MFSLAQQFSEFVFVVSFKNANIVRIKKPFCGDGRVLLIESKCCMAGLSKNRSRFEVFANNNVEFGVL